MAYLNRTYSTTRAHDIIRALHRDIKSKYPTRLNVAEFATHTNQRLVMLSLDYMGGIVRGYEVKVFRSDFKKDTKWTDYLPYCNQFYFVCPTNLIAANELPPEIGLIYADIGNIYEHYGEEAIKTSKECIRMRIVKNAKIDPVTVTDKRYSYIMKRLIFRALDLSELIEKPWCRDQDSYEEKLYQGLLDINGGKVSNDHPN